MLDNNIVAVITNILALVIMLAFAAKALLIFSQVFVAIGRLRNRSTQSPAGWRPVVVLAAAFFLGDLCLICCGCSRVSLIQLHRIEPVPSVLCKDRHAKCILCFADWSRVNVLHMGGCIPCCGHHKIHQ